jgi:hypothetical protein
MASRAESTVVNLAGLVQGIVLVTFPAASSIFTDKSEYALLGLGTVLAPVFVAVFVGLGFWWGLPVVSLVLLVSLLLVSMRLPLRAGAQTAGRSRGTGRIPARFWVYAAFAVLYGICETMNGNWSELVMTTRLGASATQASLALTAFWGMVTAGRVLFAAVSRWLSARVTFHLLALVLVASFALVDSLPRHDAAAGIAVFGLACQRTGPGGLTRAGRSGSPVAASPARQQRRLARHKIAMGLTGDPVPPTSRRGAITQKKDQRPASWQSGTRSSNCR